MLIDVACCFFCNFLQKMARQTIVIESPKSISTPTPDDSATKSSHTIREIKNKKAKEEKMFTY